MEHYFYIINNYSGPPPFSGLHRYVFLLYEQDGLRSDNYNQSFTEMKQRMKFDTKQFIKKNNLKLIAANFYCSQNKLNKKLWFLPKLITIAGTAFIFYFVYKKFL